MVTIRTILCPLDFSALCEREVALAVELCGAFGAKLVLHHNLDDASLGMSASWMWRQEHVPAKTPEAAVELRLRELLARLPAGVACEARISDGQVAPSLLFLQRQLPADLVVMATHGQNTEDHASVAERLVEETTSPVLILHEQDCSGPPIRLAAGEGERPLEVLVATDWSVTADHTVAYAFDLARVFPWRLHLLHVLSPGQLVHVESGVPMAVPGSDVGEIVEGMRRQLAALVPEELAGRVVCHVEAGDPAERIMATAAALPADLIVMGAHARGFLRRFFTRDTSLELLRRAACPVWFVPGERAAARAAD